MYRQEQSQFVDNSIRADYCLLFEHKSEKRVNALRKQLQQYEKYKKLNNAP